MYSKNERVRFVIRSLNLTQAEFASGINRSRGEIANIIYDKVVVKDNVLNAICDAYGVNRTWMETGSGEPFVPKTKQDELKEVFADVLSNKPSEKNAFIEAVAQLPDELFPVLVNSWIAAAEEMKRKLSISQQPPAAQPMTAEALHKELDRQLANEKTAKEKSEAS